jgi:hypothetical protein
VNLEYGRVRGYGAVAQLGERLNGIQEVVGSTPISSTRAKNSNRRPRLRARDGRDGGARDDTAEAEALHAALRASWGRDTEALVALYCLLGDRGNPRPAASLTVSARSMTKLEAMEERVRALSDDELADFRRWFAEFDAAAWDREVERDATAGKLDALADEALRDHKAGKTTEL